MDQHSAVDPTVVKLQKRYAWGGMLHGCDEPGMNKLKWIDGARFLVTLWEEGSFLQEASIHLGPGSALFREIFDPDVSVCRFEISKLVG